MLNRIENTIQHPHVIRGFLELLTDIDKVLRRGIKT